MSLLERVERAGNGACLREGTEAALGLDALKEQVQAIVSADEVAALQAENPGRARSEVRSAWKKAATRCMRRARDTSGKARVRASLFSSA